MHQANSGRQEARYSVHERIKIVEACFTTKLVVQTQRQYRMDFPSRNIPTKLTIKRLLAKFRETGSVRIDIMGGGTFFKVGGTSARWKEIIANFVVLIGNCDVTSIELWRHYIYTIYRSKLHYFRQNYTTMKTYRWTTWNSNRLLQGRLHVNSVTRAHHTIYSDWIKPFDACVIEIAICFHSGWH